MIRRAASFLLLLTAMVPVAVVSAKTSDRNQRMTATFTKNDCTLDDNGPCLLTGNVHMVQGTLDIQADKADIRRGDGDIKTVKLNGSPVKLKQQGDDGGWMNATASQVDYDLPNDTVVLTGNADLQQPGRGSITGGRIVYNTRTGRVQSGGEAGGGPVSMTFEPKNKTPATTTPSQPPAPAQTTPQNPPPAQDDGQDKK